MNQNKLIIIYQFHILGLNYNGRYLKLGLNYYFNIFHSSHILASVINDIALPNLVMCMNNFKNSYMYVHKSDWLGNSIPRSRKDRAKETPQHQLILTRFDA